MGFHFIHPEIWGILVCDRSFTLEEKRTWAGAPPGDEPPPVRRVKKDRTSPFRPLLCPLYLHVRPGIGGRKTTPGPLSSALLMSVSYRNRSPVVNRSRSGRPVRPGGHGRGRAATTGPSAFHDVLDKTTHPGQHREGENCIIGNADEDAGRDRPPGGAEGVSRTATGESLRQTDLHWTQLWRDSAATRNTQGE